MANFGWSYPPGAENDPYAPYNQDCDDYDDEDESTFEQIATVDFDSAYSVAAEVECGCDCVYFDVGKRNGKWFMSAVIDCDTASFVDGLTTDDGPYDTEAAAIVAGMNCAIEWMINNEVTDFEIDSRIKKG